MFGYVRPLVAELKVSEAERYRALYCGLCRAMGHATGQLSRLTLSYDFTFFAAVRLILEGAAPVFAPMRCPAHPASRRLTVEPHPTLTFTAALSAAMADAKTDDDFADERGFSRVKPALRKPFTASISRRAAKLLPPDTDAQIEMRLARLAERERAGCPSLDETAYLFGDLLGFLFALGLDGERASLASQIGTAVGKFVYLCDAADDLADDVRRGRYNPIAAGWGPLALEDGRLSPMVKSSLSASAPIGLEALGEVAEDLDPAHVFTPIVKNIVYLGLPASLGRVLDGRKAEKTGGMPGKERL